MPGTAVWMGRNGPLISLGASGLGSQVSNWLGPPHIQNRMTDVLALADCSARNCFANGSAASADAVPTRRKVRLDNGPGQGGGIGETHGVRRKAGGQVYHAIT